jgi:hypothetical protein
LNWKIVLVFGGS